MLDWAAAVHEYNTTTRMYRACHIRVFVRYSWMARLAFGSRMRYCMSVPAIIRRSLSVVLLVSQQ